MYKCTDCEEIFDKLKIYKESHNLGIYFSEMFEETPVCPVCDSSEIGEALTCEVCNEYFMEDELSYGYCDECIEEALQGYSTELGKRFILKDEEDFYLRYLNGITNCTDGGHLLHVLKKEPNPNYEKELKEYCLGDSSLWAEFYYGGSNEKVCESDKQKQAYKEAV